jgi:tetratricopeptide (TPR) repeat protein
MPTSQPADRTMHPLCGSMQGSLMHRFSMRRFFIGRLFISRLSISRLLARPLLAAALLCAAAPLFASEPLSPPTLAPHAPETLAQEAPKDIMALPPALREQLRQTVLTGDPTPHQRLQRLLDFILGNDGLAMRYRENATHSVARAYETRVANCVGFTLFFVALAREAGLDASALGIRQTLSWRQDERTLYRNSHVNALVRIGEREYVVDFAIAPVIARHRPETLSDGQLLAQYYNNLAVDHLVVGRMTAAQAAMDIALALDPAYAPHWSNAGVLRLRDGDTAAAERAYARALTLDPRDAGALFNMIGLAQRNGDTTHAAEYRRRLADVQRRDPFHQFLQATVLERSGDYRQAIALYKRAIRLHGGEHRFHAALARAYRLAGDERRALASLRRAQKLGAGEAKAEYPAQRGGLLPEL